jgi:hypothetical protein
VQPEEARQQRDGRWEPAFPAARHVIGRERRQPVGRLEKMSDETVRVRRDAERRELIDEGRRGALECPDTIRPSNTPTNSGRVRLEPARLVNALGMDGSEGGREAHGNEKRLEQRDARPVVGFRLAIEPSCHRQEHALTRDQPARDRARGARRERGVAGRALAVQGDGFLEVMLEWADAHAHIPGAACNRDRGRFLVRIPPTLTAGESNNARGFVPAANPAVRRSPLQ